MITHRTVMSAGPGLAIGALVAAVGVHIAGSARDADLAAAVAALAEQQVAVPAPEPVAVSGAPVRLSPRRGTAGSPSTESDPALDRRLAALEAGHESLLAELQLLTELAALKAEDEFEVAEAQAIADAEETDGGVDDNGRADLDDAFDADADDPAGAAQAESQLRDSLAALRLEGVAFSDARCRASVCRLDIGFDNAGDASASMPMLALAVPWNGESYVEVLDDGRGTVMYVAREGYGLNGEPLD